MLDLPLHCVKSRVDTYTFIDDVHAYYARERNLIGLSKAIEVLLDLVKYDRYDILDELFVALTNYIKCKKLEERHIEFPREGSFWLACLTLTKSVADKCTKRDQYIKTLQTYAHQILGSEKSERFLRNVT